MSKQTREAWTKSVNARLLAAQQPRSKYGAVKVTVDGIAFDSKREAQRYHELKLMEKAGEIRNLVLQPTFECWTSMGKGFSDKPIGVYRADFQYEERPSKTCDCHLHECQVCDICQGVSPWPLVVEDVKGFKTPLYRWKKKHVEAQYGITIREI